MKLFRTIPAVLAALFAAASAFAQTAPAEPKGHFVAVSTPAYEYGMREGVHEPVPSDDPLAAVGHGDAKNGGRYDIWNRNCHNAANAMLWAKRGRNIGILACTGNPENDPQYHTANWLTLPNGWACIINWGERCCWKNTGASPTIDQGYGKICAQWACFDGTSSSQYAGPRADGKGTRALPAGQKVEEAGALVCVRLAAFGRPYGTPGPEPNYSRSKRPACNTCCDERADIWKNWRGHSEGREAYKKLLEGYRASCKKACTGFLGAP